MEEEEAANPLLARETERVLRVRGWSLRQAADITGVTYSTIFNLKRGRAVKPPLALKFAQAVAPAGLEAVVTQRWTDLVTRGESEVPEVDYTGSGGSSSGRGDTAPAASLPPAPGLPVLRYVTDPETAEMVRWYEGLPKPLRDNIRRTAADIARELDRPGRYGGRKAGGDEEEETPTDANGD